MSDSIERRIIGEPRNAESAYIEVHRFLYQELPFRFAGMVAREHNLSTWWYQIQSVLGDQMRDFDWSYWRDAVFRFVSVCQQIPDFSYVVTDNRKYLNDWYRRRITRIQTGTLGVVSIDDIRWLPAHWVHGVRKRKNQASCWLLPGLVTTLPIEITDVEGRPSEGLLPLRAQIQYVTAAIVVPERTKYFPWRVDYFTTMYRGWDAVSLAKVNDYRDKFKLSLLTAYAVAQDNARNPYEGGLPGAKNW